jgi:alkylation response protein AidB-like acyl-CoA dehydrogenase
MDFSLSDDQQQLRNEALLFAQAELADPTLDQRDRDGTFSRELWDKAAQFGLAGAIAPPELGGAGLSLLDTCLMLEGLGEGCDDSGLLFAASAHLFAGLVPVLEFGTPEQRQTWVPRMASGELLVAHGMTETESGSDAFSLRTRAVLEGDHYVLNGTKAWVTNGPHCDVALVFARTGEGPALGALSCFLVPRKTEGFRVGPGEAVIGLCTAPLGELIFEDCRVPVENRLGTQGAGALVFMSSMAWERIGILAAGLGSMNRVIKASVRHAKTRRIGGRRLGSFQAVSHRLAGMPAQLAPSRVLLYQAAWRKDRGLGGAHGELTKIHVAEALIQVHLDAIRVHGALGLTREAGLERDLRNALMAQAYSGTSDVMRNLVARYLGLG